MPDYSMRRAVLPLLVSTLVLSLLAPAFCGAQSATNAATETPSSQQPVFKRYNLRCLAPLLENLDSEAPATLEEAFLAGPTGFATPLTEGAGAAGFGAGAINFPITTGNPDARRLFNQGVAHLHTLYYREAERAFRSVVHLDPDCGMGYWGLAMANELRPGRARFFAKTAVDKTDVNRPLLEQRWIDILARFYEIPGAAGAANAPAGAALTGSPGDLTARSAARIRALEDLVIEFPGDLEAKAFLIRQLTLDQFRAGIPITSHLGVDRLAAELAAEAPEHPSRHYSIFLWLERRPDRGLPAADAAPPLSPAVAEVWRYAGEAYAAAGRFQEAASLYEAALRADHRLMEERLFMPWETQNLGANYEALIDILADMGRIDEALTWARCAALLPAAPSFSDASAPDLPAIGRRLHLATLLRAERWEALLREISSSPALLSTPDFEGRAQLLFSKGLAQLILDRAADAAATSGELDALFTESISEGVSNRTESAIASARDGLAACRRLLSEPSPEPIPPGKIHELLTPGLLALLYDKAGLTGEAAALARGAAEARPGRLLPLALHGYLAFKTGDRREAFIQLNRRLRNDAARADAGLPALGRLDAIAREMQLPTPWTLPLSLPPSPALPSDRNSLGPDRWAPSPAPGFSLPDHTGREHSLADFTGKPVLLDFFLGISCAFCTEQLEVFKPHLEAFRDAGIEFVAVSTDPLAVLQHAFGDQPEKKDGTQEEFPFPVLADPDLALFKACRAFDDFEGGPLHATLLLDARGRILWADRSHSPFKEPEALLSESRRLLDLHAPK